MMKKKILGLAIIAAALTGLTSFAQDTKNDNNVNLTPKATCGKADCKAAKHDKHPNPFEGLNLTDAQKQQLKDLRVKNMQARKAAREQAGKDKAARKAQMRAQRAEAKKQYLQEVKSIIGPENYVIFLENYYVNSANNDKARLGKSDKIARKDMSNRRRDDGRYTRDSKKRDNGQYRTDKAPSK